MNRPFFFHSTSHDQPKIWTVVDPRRITVRYPDPSKGPGYPAWRPENEWQEATDFCMDEPAAEQWHFKIGPARPVDDYSFSDMVSELVKQVARKHGIPEQVFQDYLKRTEEKKA